MTPPTRPLSFIEVESLKYVRHRGKPNPTEKPSHIAKTRNPKLVLNPKRFGNSNVAMSIIIQQSRTVFVLTFDNMVSAATDERGMEKRKLAKITSFHK